jgi:ElaB/YqjD/DUF883 family membrane-anchored ribosome-binding protein
MAVNGNKEEWNDALDKARAMLEDGRREMAKATEMAREKGEEAWHSARKKSQEAWDQLRASGYNAYEDAKDRSEEVWEDTEKLVRKYPSRALGLTLLVGVIVGALLSKDRD